MVPIAWLLAVSTAIDRIAQRQREGLVALGERIIQIVTLALLLVSPGLKVTEPLADRGVIKTRLRRAVGR
jgi:hypothetical protein